MRFLLLLLVAFPGPAATLQVRISGHIKVVPVERYVAGVLAGESGSFQSAEALKAMAVAARTYGVHMRGRHAAEGFDLCDTTHCQRLEPDRVTTRLTAAAADTAGEMLWWQGKAAFTPYTRDCGGSTEDAAAIWPDQPAAYLKSHADPWCAKSADAHWQWTTTAERLAQALQNEGLRRPARPTQIAVLSRTGSGRAALLGIGGVDGSFRMSASSFRFAVGRQLGWNTLRSDRYTVRFGDGHFWFEGGGAGHGAGLCQNGAEQMGLAGKGYREILAFYYPGAAIGLNAQGLRWQRLSGENISLLTLFPEVDSAVMGLAERQLRAVAARTGWAVPAKLEIRVYPDLDTFRNATGEPGWVAAHAEGFRIELQPTATLRGRHALESTLRHEIIHLMMAGQAAPGLPVWFHEGLAEWIENPIATGPAGTPPPAEFRQTVEPSRARRAYAESHAMVAGLVRRYGELAVFGWVKRGLPPEVTNTNASQAPPNSK